ncbi:MAG: signal peptide peptidase SppA [Desulfotignum sp.]|nr:signal peptide peptidase SppA [Desulfotignum sp.]MCF8136704.1 signal peptide peptidase SppA [Desulfotignum sp.]
MFSRRHPILFFLLILTACATVLCVGGMLVVFSVSRMVFTTAGTFHESKGNIGIVEVTGPILSSRQVIENIKIFRDDDDIKAIVVRVDSPGGGVGPSQEIFRELMKTRPVKTVVASMGSVAASGGYYIAAGAQAIVANPGTITGSIGVIMEHVNLTELVQKIGISPRVIKSGEFKDLGSPFRELGDNERQLLQELVDELHQQFVSDAARARNIEKQIMGDIADGRIYTGQTALELNLVDRLGNLDDAVVWAAELAEMEQEPVPVYPKDNPISVLRKMTQTLFKDLNISGTITDNLRYIIH